MTARELKLYLDNVPDDFEIEMVVFTDVCDIKVVDVDYEFKIVYLKDIKDILEINNGKKN